MVSHHYPRLLFSNRSIKCYIIIRGISKYLQKDVSAKAIRQTFLDYFIKEQEHAFVKSSPVVPFCDPTVPFVNAGMNQFKGIFLGTQMPHFTKVSNSQKCVRVGGKHNDLNIVGKDGYHHTFFEMLGNWSFGDYFKEEACHMAWVLLTQVYKISPSRLYITYFGGDERLGLSSDLETKEIWQSLGIKEDRILPFGVKYNFWEMGLTGPCGPCTEIHFDHVGPVNRSQFVNKDLHDLTEIWNLVFIQYNRLVDGAILPLPKKHVDTGLGLERLACALQGKLSTYDTDLFDYLIKAIQKNCSNVPKYSGKFGEQDWNDIDTSYRILADHVRMITVSLADCIIPEQNQKLRRILRKCFILAETVFQKEQGLLKELSNYVVENLGDVYPEMEKNISQIHQIIDFEEDVYSSIRNSSQKEWKKLSSENKSLQNMDFVEITPGFIKALKELNSTKPKEINGDLAFRLYDTHGLDAESIEQLAQALQIEFNPNVLAQKMDEIRLKSKQNQQVSTISRLADNDLKKTDDLEKYSYSRNGTDYIFPEIAAKVLQIIEKNEFVTEVKKGSSCSLILDKTNFYSEAGGQESDKGVITLNDNNNSVFRVESVANVNNYIVHRGFFDGDVMAVGSECTASIETDRRLATMRNHTCVHLLNATLKRIKKATCQKSSKVTSLYSNLDVAIFGSKLSVDDIIRIENAINGLIKDGVDVRVDTTDSQGLYSFDQITLVPGEVYPDNDIRIVEVEHELSFVSREPCCGTHVLNTADLEDFCIISLKSLGRSTASLYAVTGERAKLARKNAEELQEDITIFRKSSEEYLDKLDMLDMGIFSLRQRLNFDVTDNSILPYVCKFRTLEDLNDISRHIKEKTSDNLKNFVDMEMQDALKSKIEVTRSNKKYMVHYLRSSMMLESVQLQRATKMCGDIPVMVIAYSDSMVKARCCVPKEFQNENFNAEKWLQQTVAAVFKGRAAPAKGQDGQSVCNMKSKKVHVQEWHNLLSESVKNAKRYINENL